MPKMTKAICEKIAKELNLDSYLGQDWDIIVADSNKLSIMIEYYINKILSDDEKYTLMHVIIASYDEMCQYYEDDKMKEEIANIIINDFDIHKNLIIYWSRPEIVNHEDAFTVTEMMREILFNKGVDYRKYSDDYTSGI